MKSKSGKLNNVAVVGCANASLCVQTIDHVSKRDSNEVKSDGGRPIAQNTTYKRARNNSVAY